MIGEIMNEEINYLLFDELEEAHGYFGNVIDELKEKDDTYPSNDVISIENNSYNIALDALNKMDEALEKYNTLRINNIEFFDEQSKIVVKYTFLYLVSIIMIKIFSKCISIEKINEIWLAMVGLLLGTVNTSMIYSNLHEYRFGNKDNRELMNRVMELREEYDINFEIARKEIQYMFSLNRNLDTELTEGKKYVKK